MTLIEQAKVIVSKAYNQVSYDEIVELSRIQTLMAIDYNQFAVLSAKQKNEYLIYQYERYIEIMNTVRQATKKTYTSTDARVMSEAEATKSHWDYRINRADCDGMFQVIQWLKDYCINRHKYNKDFKR